jgi:stage IV sporulation protein FB
MTNRALFSIFGFPVYVQRIAIFLAGYAVFALGQYGIIIALTLFVSILVHELGHSLMFRRYGTESHIMIHIFGGYSAPDRATGLTDSEWVKISAAGPLGALVALGVPALLLRRYADLSPTQEDIIGILILFNVYWGLANLAPIWPFDGGRIFYHASNAASGNDQWSLTRTVTLVASAGAIALALTLDYTFAALFVGYNAYQVFKSPSPRTVGLGGGSSPITEAAARARSQQPGDTTIDRGSGSDVLATTYEWIIKRRWDKAAPPLEALMGFDMHRDAAQEATAWHHLLDHNAPAATEVLGDRPLSPLMYATWTLLSDTSGPLDDVIQAVRSTVPGVQMVPALMLLRQSGRLEEVCVVMGREPEGRQHVRAIEQVVLHQGLVQEQIAVTSALHTLDQT